MDGEYNNNSVEMHQPERPVSSPEDHRGRIVSLIVALVVIIAIVVWVGNWSMKQKPDNERKSLSDAEKQQILDSLRREPGTPPLTQAQKAEILQSLESAPKTPPLTEAQKMEILRSLE